MKIILILASLTFIVSMTECRFTPSLKASSQTVVIGNQDAFKTAFDGATSTRKVNFMLSSDIILNNWEPFSGPNHFQGTFDGQGNTVTIRSDISLNSDSGDDILGGIFISIGSGSVVKNLTIDLGGQEISGTRVVGGLTGENNGTIENVGIINGTVVSTGNNLDNSALGGLVGTSSGKILNSYSTVAVSGLTLDRVGGIVGWNTGSIVKSYATVENDATRRGVEGNNNVGGFVGNNGGTITQSYFDKTTTKQTAGIGTGTLTGVTAYATSTSTNLVKNNADHPDDPQAEDIDQTHFPGWDTSIWDWIDGKWPVLKRR